MMPAMHRAAATCLIALAVLGCSTPIYREPTEEELEAADYGPPPGDAAERVRALALVRYQDRAVAHVEVGAPKRVWYGELGRVTRSRDVRFGWGVPFRGFRLGFASLEAFVVQGTVFFRYGRIEAIEDDGGFEFLHR